MPSEEQLRQKQATDESHQPEMLQMWLNETGTTASATDVWSSERAMTKPRPSTSHTKSRRKYTNADDAAKAA
ncbi:hypothetical protein FPOAC2_07706 [Fusarium poae]|uniref:hypothetical protein n=1 Tax=Fusarium poae TaxID=36050 RepID=UPI001CEBAB68|nr:hypothetical protein FPOAC1_007800 [Fusarium poae]KAG8668421.1 hypothetical protein FPOAC1_007800 [Fusarium poae]